ncbi:MAG: efflux RND transporter periplasmic adaptor subunit [Smithellaceae bacterium]
MNLNKVACPGKKNASRQRIVHMLFLIVILLIAGLTLIACGKEKKVEREKLVNVSVVTAEKKNIQPYLETTGTLKPHEEVTVSSEVDGIVRKIMVEEGSSVGVGTPLVTINDIDYSLEWKRSASALKQSQANLANAKAEFLRKESLYKEELITKQQFDDVYTRLALAEAEVDRAKATLETSREKLSRTKVYSPLVGAVKEKKISVGDYVRNGTPLLQLIKINPLKLDFTISEKDASSLRIGQEVAFQVDSYTGKQFKGRINLIRPHVEERTRTLEAEALVPNPGNLLKAGFFAKVSIYTSAARDGILCPITALIHDNSAIRIFVVEDNKAKERIVKLGGKYGEFVEIMEGLKENEQIVVAGQNNLSEGVKVNVAR